MMIEIKNEYGESTIFINRERNKIILGVDSSEVELSVKETKELIAKLKEAILMN